MPLDDDRTEAIMAEQPDEAHLTQYLPWPSGRMTGIPSLVRIERLELHLLNTHPDYLDHVDYGTDDDGAYGLSDAHREAHYDLSQKEGQS